MATDLLFVLLGAAIGTAFLVAALLADRAWRRRSAR